MCTAEGRHVAARLEPEKVRGKIHHHLRTCSAAVKRARTFEVQRAIKKLKTATTEDSVVLERYLSALKGSKNSQVAAIAIKNKLVKAKLLPKQTKGNELDLSKQFPLLEYTEELEVSIGGTEGINEDALSEEKARAKLLSNKVVSEEVSRVVQELSALLRGKPVGVDKTLKSKVRRRGEDAQKRLTNTVEERPMEKDDDKIETDVKIKSKSHQAASSSDSEDSERDLSNAAIQRLKTVKSAVMPLMEKKGKRNADDSEGSDIERPRKHQRRVDQDGESSDDSNDEGEKKDMERKIGPLPILSTGFVGGKGFNLGRASDDEWSDGDEELESIDEDADGAGKQREERKNRKGQRARRAIWEKKFGKNANHIKVREKETREKHSLRSSNWTQTGYGRDKLPQQDAGWSGVPRVPRLINDTPMQKSLSTKSELEMHPSWIAKQKLKEKAEAALQNKGTAKKIVFD